MSLQSYLEDDQFRYFQCPRCSNIFARRGWFWGLTHCPLCQSSVLVPDHEFGELDEETKKQLRIFAAIEETVRDKKVLVNKLNDIQGQLDQIQRDENTILKFALKDNGGVN